MVIDFMVESDFTPFIYNLEIVESHTIPSFPVERQCRGSKPAFQSKLYTTYLQHVRRVLQGFFPTAAVGKNPVTLQLKSPHSGTPVFLAA